MTISQPMLPGAWAETEDQPYLGDEFRDQTRSDSDQSEGIDSEADAKEDQD